jgi:hypothetical protein
MQFEAIFESISTSFGYYHVSKTETKKQDSVKPG